jgi:membrane associated rhomboid family serine protease
MNSLFGPLGKKYCNLFLFLSAVALVFLVMAVIGLLMMFAQKKADGSAILGGIIVGVTYLIMYTQNRILYNMCKSI